MSQTATTTLDKAARNAVGNWRRFGSFCWFARPEDADDFAIFYTHNRDSGLLDLSNFQVIAKEMEPFIERGGVRSESHSHWACGWIAGFAIRVYHDGQVTPAFAKWHELQERIDDYPILDETDYSNQEYAAAVENIANAGYKIPGEYDVPDNWAGQVYGWLLDNGYHCDNTDDQGYWPSDEELAAAIDGLEFEESAV
jgi:hypothetical protein